MRSEAPELRSSIMPNPCRRARLRFGRRLHRRRFRRRFYRIAYRKTRRPRRDGKGAHTHYEQLYISLVEPRGRL